MTIGALAAYLAVCIDYAGVFTHGERGTCAIMASTTIQAHSLMNICKGIFADNPRFAALVDTITSDTIVLRNRVDISIRPANYRSIRGVTAVAAIAEEISAWQSDELGSRNPDKQILAAVRPALATTGGPLISTLWQVRRAMEGFQKAFRPERQSWHSCCERSDDAFQPDHTAGDH